MNRIGPGLAVRITDFNDSPRELLRELRAPLARLCSTQQLPVAYVRRGWLHGSHLLVTARPDAGRSVDLTEFADDAQRLALARAAHAPDEQEYLRRAEQLARWENVQTDPLPLHPHGHVDVLPAPDQPGVPPALAQARDQIMGRFLEPVLATAEVPDADLLATVARIMALVVRLHPRGIGVGSLAFRSHVEGVSSATGNHVDLRAQFAARFSQDEDVFLNALTGPVPDGALRAWESALSFGWGIAEGLAAADHISDTTLQDAVAPMEYPLGKPVRSEFIAEYMLNRQAAEATYRQVAYRLVLNAVYPSLTCFGITPMQRYYLCYGLSEMADRLTGMTSIERMRQQRAQPTLEGARH